jgi:hypothetical protein
MTDDLVKQLREAALDYYYEDIIAAAADRIEQLEKYKSLHAKCDQTSSELMQNLVNRLRDAHKRIEQLEGALCQVWVLNNRRDRFKDEINMVVSTALGEKTDD